MRIIEPVCVSEFLTKQTAEPKVMLASLYPSAKNADNTGLDSGKYMKKNISTTKKRFLITRQNSIEEHGKKAEIFAADLETKLQEKIFIHTKPFVRDEKSIPIPFPFDNNYLPSYIRAGKKISNKTKKSGSLSLVSKLEESIIFSILNV